VAVVSNSSALIALARIQRLDLLPAIFESVLIPPAVAREIAPSIPILPTWVRIQAPSLLPPASLLRRRLGDGEWEALALAIELRADWIILDDLPARRSAEAAGLNVIGNDQYRITFRFENRQAFDVLCTDYHLRGTL
jgi:predicted nucleic acid-binding protein